MLQRSNLQLDAQHNLAKFQVRPQNRASFRGARVRAALAARRKDDEESLRSGHNMARSRIPCSEPRKIFSRQFLGVN